MIINCPCGKKKFEVDSNLIPDQGKLLKCGSCDQTWFYTPNKNIPTEVQAEKEIIKKILKPEITKEKDVSKDNINQNKNLDKKGSFYKENSKNKKSSINFSKFLSYLVVGIISFIAIIIILDTFKSPLSNIFPDLELLLYNLFETIKDIDLFLKDLFFNK